MSTKRNIADSPSDAVAVTSVRIERERLNRFRLIAEANRRSVSQELRWLIDRHIEEDTRKAAA